MVYESDMLQLVNNTVGLVLVAADDEGKIVQTNRTAERMFGYCFGEMEGRPVDELLPERFRVNHKGFRGLFYANPSIRPMGASRALYGIRKSGSEFRITVTLSPAVLSKTQSVLAIITELFEAPQVAQPGSPAPLS